MSAATDAERIKDRRRGSLAMAALVGLLAALGAAGGKANTAWALESGYSAAWVNVSLMNAILMPLAMAALASRLWDRETQGHGCRLLFTLQGRESLFDAKALLGMEQNAAAVLCECAGIAWLGRWHGFTQALDPARMAWLFGSTLTVNALVFFAALLLSVRSGAQVLPLAAGMACSLLGVFTAFMPERLLYFTPWAYYMPLSAVRMAYDPATRTATFFELPFPWGLLLLAALLAAAAWLGARRAVRGQEV